MLHRTQQKQVAPTIKYENSITCRVIWAGNVPRRGEMRNSYKILVGKPEGKRLPGRIKGIWDDNLYRNLEK
jgi:hypothetical protein